jgi:hypothetical protein
MFDSSSAFRPCVARKVPRMTLRVVQPLLPSDDDSINGFGTLVLPVCRIKNPYLSTVLTQVCRMWHCCSSSPAPPLLWEQISLHHQPCHPQINTSMPLTVHESLHTTRDKTVLIRNIGRVSPCHHSCHSALLIRLRLVVRAIPGDSYNVFLSYYPQKYLALHNLPLSPSL